MNNDAVDENDVNVNRENKSSVFCDLFSDKKNALSLYNAINGTTYDDETELEIVTMEDVIYLHQKNDVSVLFDSKRTLWEHQSSLNYNMPVRGLMYYGRNLEGILGEGMRKLYWRKLVKIPAPEYYVLYNGTAKMPDRKELKLSDAFMTPASGYEFTAHMININTPHNMELMDKCPTLKEYATLVRYTRENKAKGMKNEEAVDKAVQRCINEGILKDYLLKKRSEAVRMFLTEFDEDTWRESMREEGREEGEAIGEARGKAEGIRIFIADKREDNIPDDRIKEKLMKHYNLTGKEAEGYLKE